MKNKLHWILPIIVILIGISLLTFKNYQDLTEKPSESWSREVEVASTSIQSNLSAKQISGGGYELQYFSGKGYIEQTFNKSFETINKELYNIPYTKWTEVYTENKEKIYADNNSMYLLKNNEKITDVHEFISLKRGVIYQKEKGIFYLNRNSSSEQLITKDLAEDSSISVFESKDQTYIMVSETDSNITNYKLFNWNNSEVSLIDQQEITLKPTLTLKDIYFTINSESLLLLLNAKPSDKWSQLPEQNFYFASQKVGATISFRPVEFKDPHGNNNLKELEDITLDLRDGKTNMLFRATGRTNTKFKEPLGFNVYGAHLKDNGNMSVTRLSNTHRLSKNPVWVARGVIAWLDVGGSMNRILMASKRENVNLSEPSMFSKDIILRSVGKTLPMLIGGLFTFILTTGWYVSSIVFMGFMVFRSNNALDKAKEWVFYAPVLLYLTFALLLNNHLFSQKLMARLPGYLDFYASPLVLITVFALLIYTIMFIADLKRKWTIPIRVTYFIIVHLSFLMIFVGPFLF